MTTVTKHITRVEVPLTESTTLDDIRAFVAQASFEFGDDAAPQVGTAQSETGPVLVAIEVETE